MFRLLGFLIGSATSVFIILLIIGMPTLNLNDDEAAQERYDAAIEKLKAKQDEIESVTGKLSDDVARVAQSVEDGIAAVAEPPVEAPRRPRLKRSSSTRTSRESMQSHHSLWKCPLTGIHSGTHSAARSLPTVLSHNWSG